MARRDASWTEVAPHGASTQLIVFLHGWTRSPAELAGLREIALRRYPDADHLVPRLPISMFARVRAGDLTRRIVAAVDAAFAARGTYKEIIFVGHSAGAMLARAAWALAWGAQENAMVHPAQARLGALRHPAGAARGVDPRVQSKRTA